MTFYTFRLNYKLKSKSIQVFRSNIFECCESYHAFLFINGEYNM